MTAPGALIGVRCGRAPFVSQDWNGYEDDHSRKVREIRAWLGPVVDNHTDQDIEHLVQAAHQIAARWPGIDDRDEREAALTVAHRLMVESPTAVVRDLAHDLRQARLDEARAMVALQQAAATLVRTDDRSVRGIESLAGFARTVLASTPTPSRPWLPQS